ncbi:MAG: lipoprotein LpqH [Segniliparus sp.]|uniref:lipoprotein LpqH n=1 Tax=Segniliparus sp. TaxID=2804064 RepID=UPI003F392354
MTNSRAQRALAALAVLGAAALPAACAGKGSTPNGGPAPATTAAASAEASLVLAGKAYPLQDVRCIAMGDAVLVTGKTKDGGKVSVDTGKGKVADLIFKADGLDYFWEPGSTGGADDPVLAKDGRTYTVTGKIKQLHDATKLSDFTFKATCPR